MVELLLRHGSDPESRCYGTSALGLAARPGDGFDVVSVLLRHGASARTPSPGLPLLFEVASAKVAHLLVSSGAEIHGITPDGVNAINNLARRPHPSPELFCYFLDIGLDPYAPGFDGYCAVHFGMLIAGCRQVILQRALHHHPRFQALNVGEFLVAHPFHYKMGHVASSVVRVRRLLGREGARLIFRDNPTAHRWTALCRFACFLSPLEVDALLDCGFDLEAEGCSYGTALMVAASKGRFDIVKALVRRGARISYVAEAGVYRSAVEMAKSNGSHEIVTWLVRDRFLDQKKLCGDGDNSTAGKPPVTRPWSGIKTYPYPIPKFASRRATESLFEYAMRISADRKYVKNFCRGKVMVELSPEREQELLDQRAGC